MTTIRLHYETNSTKLCSCHRCNNNTSYRKFAVDHCVKDSTICGVVCLEIPPRERTILVNNNKGFARVSYPYMIMVINYRIINEKYIYEGISGSGLRIYLKETSLETLNDLVNYNPFEYYTHGLVCTPHQFDGKSHDSVSELIKDVINIYFGITHSGYVSYNDWKTNQKRSLFDFLIDSLYLSINSYSGWETIIPPKDSILVNLDFFRENKIDKILDSFIKEFQKSS